MLKHLSSNHAEIACKCLLILSLNYLSLQHKNKNFRNIFVSLSVKDAETKDPPSHRVAFSTRSKIDVMDDGYKWRKYGKKSVKNNINKR